MLFIIQFPNISPDIFSIEIFGTTLALRWYALAYIAGILFGWQYIVALVKRDRLWINAPMAARQVEDLMTWMVVGIIVGGRLGFVLFYNWGYYSQNVIEIAKVWNGGMSFHGGLLGVIIAALLFSWRNKLSYLSVGDAVAAGAPLGLLFGRIANFINGELWGRPSDASWAVIFPSDVAQSCPLDWGIVCARHPSQLYEAALEGAVLFILMGWFIWRKGGFKVPGRMIGIFLAGYGIARFIVEFFREPDEQFLNANALGHVVSIGDIGVTMGQLLSLPMILGGILLLSLGKMRK
ncbi:MAG: prolipoprotein diacylglyceryl transferase [Rhodobacteraceae bacterium]|nr:prolipoprotein diacylglyceryl transferase [Paracoccaceae bacterium]